MMGILRPDERSLDGVAARTACAAAHEALPGSTASQFSIHSRRRNLQATQSNKNKTDRTRLITLLNGKVGGLLTQNCGRNHARSSTLALKSPSSSTWFTRAETSELTKLMRHLNTGLGLIALCVGLMH
jgi:hypothetical protein